MTFPKWPLSVDSKENFVLHPASVLPPTNETSTAVTTTTALTLAVPFKHRRNQTTHAAIMTMMMIMIQVNRYHRLLLLLLFLLVVAVVMALLRLVGWSCSSIHSDRYWYTTTRHTNSSNFTSGFTVATPAMMEGSDGIIVSVPIYTILYPLVLVWVIGSIIRTRRCQPRNPWTFQKWTLGRQRHYHQEPRGRMVRSTCVRRKKFLTRKVFKSGMILMTIFLMMMMIMMMLPTIHGVGTEEGPVMMMTATTTTSATAAAAATTTTTTTTTTTPNPFLVLCLVDGNILIYDAYDGTFHSGFRSGIPLVGASSTLTTATTTSNTSKKTSRRRIVPGLDGRLYITSDQDSNNNNNNKEGGTAETMTLHPLTITVVDVLQNPVKTCSSEHECGIVTATKATSLFALDVATGQLVWYQTPNGKTTTVSTPSRLGTVLLQREDFLVRQISTDSGDQVWNVTLGTFQALEFGDHHTQQQESNQQQPPQETQTVKNHPTTDPNRLPDSGKERSLPDGTTEKSLERAFQRDIATTTSSKSSHPILPSVIFGPDGLSLTLVDPRNARRILWRQEFPSVVASVFGLSGSSWKPLTVLEDVMTNQEEDEEQQDGGEYNSNDDDDDDNYYNNNDATLVNEPSTTRQQMNKKALSPSQPPSPFLLPQQHHYYHHYHHPGSSNSRSLSRQSLLSSSSSSSSSPSTSFSDWYDSDPMGLTFYKPPTWQEVLANQLQFGRIRERFNFLFHMPTECSLPGAACAANTYPPLENHPHHQHHHHHQSWMTDYLKAHQKERTSNQQYQHEHYFPIRLALPSAPPDAYNNHMQRTRDGLFLPWPLVATIVISVIGIGAIAFRWVYYKKKQQWMQLMARSMVATSMRQPTTTTTTQESLIAPRSNCENQDSTLDERRHDYQVGSSNDDCDTGKSHNHQNGNKTSTRFLRRTQSMPEVPKDTLEEHSRISTVDLFVNGCLDRRNTDDGIINAQQFVLSTENDLDKNKEASNGYPPTNTTAVPTASGNSSTSQGVGLIDGIPLVRYSRYKSEFEQILALGKGGFGTVFRCKNVLDGREYAIKKVFIRHDQRQPQEFSQRLQRVLREVKILALLDHPNIVRYYTAWLELEQGTNDKDSKSAASAIPSASDYYLLGSPSPTTKNDTLSSRQVSGDHATVTTTTSADRRPTWDPWRKQTNLTGRQKHVKLAYDDSYNRSQSDPDMSHIRLDDCGFTFDRSGDDHNNPSFSCSGSKGDPTTSTENSMDRRRYGTQGDVSIEGSHSAGSVEPSSTWSQDDTEHITRTIMERKVLDTTKSESAIVMRHTLYIQMQLCSQKTLADFLANEEARRGPSGGKCVDIPYALSLFLQIAQGVKQIHAQGLIHRDLKPNNCFIDDSGVVKVGDFGLSREAGEKGNDVPSKRPSTLGCDGGDNTAGVGTRSYASPEQMNGSDYDSSTDVYSLGIMLFELCYPMYTVSICLISESIQKTVSFLVNCLV